MDIKNLSYVVTGGSEENLMMYGLTSRDIIQGVKVVSSIKINELMSESDVVLTL